MSRFQPLTAYTSVEQRYELLPFKFEPLGQREVVLSNMVGEFAILSRNKLEALVGHTLAASDPDYGTLRAKHMLREPGEQAPIELLALKTRYPSSRRPAPIVTCASFAFRFRPPQWR